MDFSGVPHADKNFDFYDQRLMDLIQNKDPEGGEFFRLLALCHTVMPEYKDGEYR